MRGLALAVALWAAAAWLGSSRPAGAAAGAAVPPRVEIRYQVFLGSMKIGEGRDVFQHDGRVYSVVS